MADKPVLQSESVTHCLNTISSIIARESGDPRSIFQLGYNLGRLSELTGGGRETFWDPWKAPVETWNRAEMKQLVQDLHRFFNGRRPHGSGGEGPGSASAESS